MSRSPAFVYFDESGTHAGSQVVASAAVWATPEVWAAWELEWCLQKHPIRVVHAVEYHNRFRQFAGWTEEQRNSFCGRVLPVISRHQLRGRIGGYHREVLVQALAGHPRVRKWIEDPYFMVFMFTLRRTWEQLQRLGFRELEFVHEENDYIEGLNDYFSIIRKRFPGCLARLTFRSKLESIPLQAADVLAFEGRRQMLDFGQDLRRGLRAIDPTGANFCFVRAGPEETLEAASILISAHERRYGSAAMNLRSSQ